MKDVKGKVEERCRDGGGKKKRMGQKKKSEEDGRGGWLSLIQKRVSHDNK